MKPILTNSFSVKWVVWQAKSVINRFCGYLQTHTLENQVLCFPVSLHNSDSVTSRWWDYTCVFISAKNAFFWLLLWCSPIKINRLHQKIEGFYHIVWKIFKHACISIYIYTYVHLCDHSFYLQSCSVSFTVQYTWTDFMRARGCRSGLFVTEWKICPRFSVGSTAAII